MFTKAFTKLSNTQWKNAPKTTNPQTVNEKGSTGSLYTLQEKIYIYTGDRAPAAKLAAIQCNGRGGASLCYSLGNKNIYNSLFYHSMNTNYSKYIAILFFNPGLTIVLTILFIAKKRLAVTRKEMCDISPQKKIS